MSLALYFYRLFRKDRCWEDKMKVKEQLKCVELCTGTADKPTGSLWVRINGQTKTSDILRLFAADHLIKENKSS